MPLNQMRAYLALVAIATLWGSFPALIKLGLHDFPPVFFAAVRCTIASIFLAVMLARSGAEAARGAIAADLRPFLILGLTGIFISTQLSYVAIYFTTATNAVIVQAATPVMVALGARFYLGERIERLQWAGVAVSALGVLLVVTNGRLAALRIEELHVGDFINLAALAGWSVYTVFGKRVLATHSPALATTGAYLAGTLLIIPTALLMAPLFPAPRIRSGLAWAIVIYQALPGAIAHLWWYKAVEVVGPSRSAMFLNLQPVVGIALAWLILSESVGVWQVAGAACVLGGVTLTTRAQASPETA